MNNKSIYLLMLLYLCMSIGCSKYDEELVSNTSKQASSLLCMTRSGLAANGDELVVLGEKLTNPFTVENMQVAYNSLKRKVRTIGELDISAPTHKYIKFMPQDSVQLELIEADTTLDLYSYPLDYEILSEGTDYIDPNLPEGQPHYRYAAIPVSYTIPAEINYQILAELYIPKVGTPTKGGSTLTEEDVELLTEQAEILAGYEPEPETRASKYQPAGYIQVWDDALNKYIGLEGVKIRARRWFTTHCGYTNTNGYYTCNGKFKRPANYSIIWERKYWDIRSGALGQAYYNGPKKKGDWNFNIRNKKSLRYATIHRAAFFYWYRPNYMVEFLSRPIHARKVKICYYHKKGNGINGDYWGSLGAGILPDIRIYGENNTGWRETQYIFGTTIHELTHAAHLQAVGHIKFLLQKKILKESWARYVQMLLTDREYARYQHDLHEAETIRIGPYLIKFNKADEWNLQDWNVNDKDKNYTSLFIDLADGSNQRQYAQLKEYSNVNLYINDRIGGIPPTVLEDAMHRAHTVRELRDNIKKLQTAQNLYGINDTSIRDFFEVFLSL